MLNCAATDFFSKPFKYFVGSGAFDPSMSLRILDWLEKEAPWDLVKADFYEQYEFDFLNVETPNELSFLRSKPILLKLKKGIESLFEVKLINKIDLTAHKLVAGQLIRLHNDFVPGKETHRLLIQLNRGWNADNGGLLMLFNSTNPADVHKIILPAHNTLSGFAISPHSNHAVSKIYQGERYTLVYSFYQR